MFFRPAFSVVTEKQQMLMRLIDDYLYVTTSLTKAKAFLAMMVQGMWSVIYWCPVHFSSHVRTGHPEYGCFISKDKTLINFDCDSVDVMNMTLPKQNGILGPL
jgi:telomerase reverse transcriptase